MDLNSIPLQRTNAFNSNDDELHVEIAEWNPTDALNDSVIHFGSGIGGLVSPYEAFQQYIDCGADINNTKCEGDKTPLMVAVMKENIDLINLLLFYDANVLTKNDADLTVFDIIAHFERESGEEFNKHIKMLLEEKLSFNAKNTAN